MQDLAWDSHICARRENALLSAVASAHADLRRLHVDATQLESVGMVVEEGLWRSESVMGLRALLFSSLCSEGSRTTDSALAVCAAC